MKIEQQKPEDQKKTVAWSELAKLSKISVGVDDVDKLKSIIQACGSSAAVRLPMHDLLSEAARYSSARCGEFGVSVEARAGSFRAA